MESVQYSKAIPVYKHYDVVVCGAGPAGICAAVAAARHGAKVALLERYGTVGGCLTLGYVAPVAGMVGKGTMRQEVCDLLGVGDNDAYAWKGYCHDMQKAKTVLTEFVDHENIDVYLQTMVADAWMDGDTIRGVVISTKEGLKIISGSVVIDATGDGDVAEFAGCIIEKGREDGLMQPVTLEFLVDNVEEDGIICIGDISDVQLHGKRFLDWCKEQSEKGLIPKNAAAVRMCPTVNKGERHFNTTQVNGIDSTKVEDLFKAELELRRQIDTLVDFFQKYLPFQIFMFPFLLRNTFCQNFYQLTAFKRLEKVFCCPFVLFQKLFQTLEVIRVSFLLTGPYNLCRNSVDIVSGQ